MLRPMPIEPVPPETARAARAAFPQGHRDLRLADALATLCTDDTFQALFPRPGQPAWPPRRLACVTLLQCAEGLSDRQAAHAVRRRRAWQDVLRLERTEAGFDAAVHSEFRTRRMTGAAEYGLFDTWLAWGRDRHLIQARGRQRPDSTPSLAAVRAVNRIEVVGETLRRARQRLASGAPAGWRTVSPAEWPDRYARRAAEDRLPPTPAARAALALAIGPDGWRLRAAREHAAAPPWLRAIPAVVVRRRVWRQHYRWDGTPLQWRAAGNRPPAAPCIRSPDDRDAHDARPPTPPWVGDKGHLTDSGEDDVPPLSTHVDTTRGPAADGAAPPKLHAALAPRDRRPRPPLVAAGCLDADLREAHDGVERWGPTRLDDHGHARAGAGFDAPHSQSDWDRQRAPCPAGQTSISWTPAVGNRAHPVIQVKCSPTECRRGDDVTHWSRAKERDPRRARTIRPQPQYQALQAARQREATAAVQTAYAHRAGIDGPISRATRRRRLRRARAIGLRRVHRGHIFAAGGLNV
jgi:transposase